MILFFLPFEISANSNGRHGGWRVGVSHIILKVDQVSGHKILMWFSLSKYALLV